MSDIPKYPAEDKLFSVRNGGLQREIEADLKTLDELNFDSFLEEGGANNEDSESENVRDSVDEDDFFLENEEANRNESSKPMSPGPLLQKCFKTVLGVELTQTRIPPPSRKVSYHEIACCSSDSDGDLDEISVDEIFDGFISEDSRDSLFLDKAPLPETQPQKARVLTLSCPFMTMGCTFQSSQPNVIAQHLKKMHKRLHLPKKCCGSEFQTQMDYDNHVKNAHL